MKLLLIPAILLLAGCASDGELALEKSIVEAQIAKNAVPTFTISCATGCSAEYNDPSKSGITLPKRTNGADVAISALGVVSGAIVPVIAGKVLTTAFNAAGNTDSYNQTATPTIVQATAPVIVDPVVVQATAPVIVDPVVVTAAPPVIVNPVIVPAVPAVPVAE